MAYQVQNITALGQVLSHVSTFAAAQGWTVSGNDYTHPSMGGAITTTLSNPGGADTLMFAPSEVGAPSAILEAPHMSTGIRPPTKVHMFCSLSPQPYIALCVEFGANLFRHLYFGYMEKLGAYNGGEVLSASNHESVENGIFATDFDDTEHQFLFRGHCVKQSIGQGGGVRIDHVNNATLWRKFMVPDDNTYRTFDAPEDFQIGHVFGGMFDGINDGFVAHAESPFVASNILVPINLYAPRNIGANPFLTPIGRPAGVRMVNMKNLEPGVQINVGMINWRVFPAHSKQTFDRATYSGSWPTAETSGYVGYAYPET